jgi:hypothetical protein
VSGSFYGDSDWYQIDLGEESTVTVTCEGEFEVLFGYIDGRGGCPAQGFWSSATAPLCQVATLTETLPAGTWWIWVGPEHVDFDFCGMEYVLTVDGYDPTTGIEEGVSWGTIKARYR